MAKIVLNEKGFKILALTSKECEILNFGTKFRNYHEIICDDCNDLITDHDEVYYIPVLNRIFCEKCLIAWYNTATVYSEDKSYEENHYKYVVATLEANDCKVENHIKKIL